MPADEVFEATSGFDPEGVYDAGYPAPLGGRTFGVAVDATPDGEVEGEPANPHVDASLTDLLDADVPRRVLDRAQLTNADSVDWRRDLEPLDPEWDVPAETTLLGTDTTIRLMAGVVARKHGLRAVYLHVTDVQPDDRVVVTCLDSRPVGTTDGAPFLGEDGWVGRQRYERTLELVEMVNAAVQQD